jgi:hypothetical protein
MPEKTKEPLLGAEASSDAAYPRKDQSSQYIISFGHYTAIMPGPGGGSMLKPTPAQDRHGSVLRRVCKTA